MQKRGVRCYFDNAEIAGTVNILCNLTKPKNLTNTHDMLNVDLIHFLFKSHMCITISVAKCNR